jgi:hypothetical protein
MSDETNDPICTCGHRKSEHIRFGNDVGCRHEEGLDEFCSCFGFESIGDVTEGFGIPLEGTVR